MIEYPRILQALALVGIGSLTGCGVFGCAITSENQGTLSLRFGTEISVEHRAAKTSDEEARIQFEPQPLDAWVSDDDEDPNGG